MNQVSWLDPECHSTRAELGRNIKYITAQARPTLPELADWQGIMHWKPIEEIERSALATLETSFLRVCSNMPTLVLLTVEHFPNTQSPSLTEPSTNHNQNEHHTSAGPSR